MLDKLRKTITSVLSYIEIQQDNSLTDKQNDNSQTLKSTKKIQRNSTCPLCDSGKKYKHCCGKL